MFYIFGSCEAAFENSRLGGTGFLAATPVDAVSKVYQFYGVTAAHVIRQAKTPVLRFNKRFEDGIDVFEAPASRWAQHPDGDDISVCPLQINTKFLRTLGIETDRFLSISRIESENIGIGDDVFMLGRFAQHSGSKTQNIPVVRFGNISTMPTEPIESPHGIKQVSFLVECRSIPGHSGAPVFVYKRLDFEKPDPVSPVTGLKLPDVGGTRQLVSDGYWLLGMNWCHLEDQGKENTGMAGVIPAWKILEVINTEQFVNQRKELAERIQNQAGDKTGSRTR